MKTIIIKGLLGFIILNKASFNYFFAPSYFGLRYKFMSHVEGELLFALNYIFKISAFKYFFTNINFFFAYKIAFNN